MYANGSLRHIPGSHLFWIVRWLEVVGPLKVRWYRFDGAVWFQTVDSTVNHPMWLASACSSSVASACGCGSALKLWPIN
ncbi:hypothetical protein Patl1_00989 [Pistacia atlantica]|uniref:Uncharacterized protein n=1 Tax=Pistacia atlantica TaxID=434234 RepID=A0ACC1CBR9_9ROSI|nr:hypothetical protein Patl1_00989 [Pistacia atlantica]